MKTKLVLILLAVFLPLSVFVLNADELSHKQEIPINPVIEGSQDWDNRSLTRIPIECHYFSMMRSIMTTIRADIGNIVLTVTNCSTGSVWYSSFDSTMEPQNFLSISGESGFYEIIYVTESGNLYKGSFTID